MTGILIPVGSLLKISQAADTTYYVSSSSGSDDHDGLSMAAPFETIDKVNRLDLEPGDNVLFKCGDTWRATMLSITGSGTAEKPILFGSYPLDGADRPVLSGAQPIAGWTAYRTNIYVADLDVGQNAGKFAHGVNQCFRGDQRLPMGRWPNLDDGNNGYATIDAHSGSQITDNDLPSGDWTGAVAHIKGMRWYILNREVTGDAGQTLTLGAAADCWGDSCAGWGYFLNRHPETLDQEGEWYYDPASHRAYLYTSGGVPADGEIEGSVVLKDDDRSWGGVTLGEDLNSPGISHVTVQNLCIQRWFRHGIATPTNHAHFENHHVALLDNTIADVDGVGINLASWVWGAQDGRPDGWRGGYAMTIQGNVIDSANHMGINLYSRNTTISHNIIRDVGIIDNLGAAGLGCGFGASGGACTEDGDGIRIKIDKADDTGNGNRLTDNRLERIAYNGIDVFGYGNTFEHNVIDQACVTKGDCGGVRTFGNGSLTTTPVHDLAFDENIIVDTLGNTDGCRDDYQALFGFGFYIDNYSRNVALTGNTVIGSSVHGILYQRSTGSITGNTLYDNSRNADWSGQVWLTESPTSVATHTGNILYSLNGMSWTLSLAQLSTLGSSDANSFFSPYRVDQIRAGGDRSLASWQAYSGLDSHSTEAWFTLDMGDPPRSRIFYNDTAQTKTVDLGASAYFDLDQNGVQGTISLPPCTSRILIYAGSLTSCKGDLAPVGSPDGDVDGLDLFGYALDSAGISLEDFSAEFGRNDCPVGE